MHPRGPDHGVLLADITPMIHFFFFFSQHNITSVFEMLNADIGNPAASYRRKCLEIFTKQVIIERKHQNTAAD